MLGSEVVAGSSTPHPTQMLSLSSPGLFQRPGHFNIRWSQSGVPLLGGCGCEAPSVSDLDRGLRRFTAAITMRVALLLPWHPLRRHPASQEYFQSHSLSCIATAVWDGNGDSCILDPRQRYFSQATGEDMRILRRESTSNGLWAAEIFLGCHSWFTGYRLGILYLIHGMSWQKGELFNAERSSHFDVLSENKREKV